MLRRCGAHNTDTRALCVARVCVCFREHISISCGVRVYAFACIYPPRVLHAYVRTRVCSRVRDTRAHEHYVWRACVHSRVCVQRVYISTACGVRMCVCTSYLSERTHKSNQSRKTADLTRATPALSSRIVPLQLPRHLQVRFHRYRGYENTLKYMSAGVKIVLAAWGVVQFLLDPVTINIRSCYSVIFFCAKLTLVFSWELTM